MAATFDKPKWMREYMREYRKGIRRRAEVKAGIRVPKPRAKGTK